MRALRRITLGILVVLMLVLMDAGAATAFFSAGGNGSGQATVATINGPSSVTTQQSGANITVSWGAASLSSGTAVQGYRVTRSDGTSVCGSPTLVTSLTCTDSAVPAGTYTYTVTAVYNSWDSSAISPSVTVLTAPTILSSPSNPSTSAGASFGFVGGNGSSYECELDGAAYGPCTTPTAYSGLADGSHTFSVYAVRGNNTGPVATYTWLIDTTAPTQTLSLASGAVGAYMSATTLYYNGSSSTGSFKLTDTVADSGSGPASAMFPGIAATGWTHASQTVKTPSGGPYTSTKFSWTANPGVPTGYSVTGADAAGNTTSTPLTFVDDSTPPSGGSVTVNGTAATAAGSTSTAANSTSLAIINRTDYTDSGSGLQSSVLTVQSEALSGSACGSLGSGGPFTRATTITGTTPPSGAKAGYCYVYTLTGTDNVGNVASVTTTVVDNALSFTVTTQPTAVTAGVATAATSVVVTAIMNGATDTSYTGSTLTWGGANASPGGAAPTLPTSPTWSGGQATFGITLVDAEKEVLTVTDGTRSATFATITVSAGAAASLAWTSVSSPAGTPSPCYFTCTYANGFGNGQTWTASVSITDADGNIVSKIGAAQKVTLALGGTAAGGVTPASLTIRATGSATSTGSVMYTSAAQGSFTDTLTATDSPYTSATASFSR